MVREFHFFRLVGRIVLGFDIGQERELREKFLDAAELKREFGELLDLVQPTLVVVVSFLEIIVVAGVHDEPQHFRGAPAGGFGFKLRNGGSELRPREHGFFGHGGNALKAAASLRRRVLRNARREVAELRFRFQSGLPAIHRLLRGEILQQFFRAFAADAGKQLHEPLEGNFVARVGDKFQIGGGVLDMRLLKKTDAAGDGKRNLLPRQFQLQFQRVKMRAIQHGDLVQARALLAQFQGALRDERRLLAGVVALHRGRFEAGLAGGREFLGELIHVGGDGGVGHREISGVLR